MIGALVLLAALQSAVLLVGQAPLDRTLVGLCLFVVTVLEAQRPWLFRRMGNAGLWIVAALAVLNFTALAWSSAFHVVARMAQAAVLIGYASVSLAGLLASTNVLAGSSARAAGFMVAVLLLLSEFLLGQRIGYFEWTGGVPIVGTPSGSASGMGQFLPGTVATSSYPENRSGHVDDPGALSRSWRVHVTDTSGQAHIEYPMLRAGHLRVVLNRDTVTTPWSVELLGTSLHLDSATLYEVQFSARASTPGRAMAKIALNVAPWDFLTDVGTAELGNQWQQFTFRFSMPAESRPVKLYFDIGLLVDTIDFSNIRLHAVGDTVPIGPFPESRHIVRYRLNSQGCRGAEMAWQQETPRILVSGGSAAIGIGVHEEFSFASRLSALLATTQDSSGRWRNTQVVNCAVFGTLGESAMPFVARTVRAYQPDAIVLTVADHEAVSVTDDPADTDVPHLRWLDRVLLTWNWLHSQAVTRRSPDRATEANAFWLSDSLTAFVRTANAPVILLIVRFDNAPSSLARVQAISSAARRMGALVLDAGPKLLHAHDRKDLVVRPDFDLRPNAEAHALISDTLAVFLQSTVWHDRK